MPHLICDTNYVLKVGLSNAVMFIYLFTSIAKFMFICIWENIPVLDDSFIAVFLTLLAWMHGMLSALVKLYLPGRPVFNQAYCKGAYYESWSSIPPKYAMENIVSGVPFLTHIILTILVTVKKIANDQRNQEQAAANPESGSREAPKSLGSMFQNFFLLFGFFFANALFSNLNK